MSTPNPTGTAKTSFLSGRKMWFWIAAALGIIATTLLIIILQGLTSTTTYYVLNKEVPARTLITQDMLTGVVTSTGGQPPTALDAATAANGQTYTKIKLEPGDVLTQSNAGSLTPLTQGLPDNYVVASFKADPNVAAGGNLQRGDYVDITAILTAENGVVSRLVLQRVLIVSATSDLSTSASTDDSSTSTSTTPTTGGDTNATSSYAAGIPAVYTVGLTQEDANKLALAEQSPLVVTLSSADSVKNGVKTPADISTSMDDLFTQTAGDSGKGTDATFGVKDDGSTSSDSSTSTSTDSGTTDTSTDAPTDTATTPAG